MEPSWYHMFERQGRAKVNRSKEHSISLTLSHRTRVMNRTDMRGPACLTQHTGITAFSHNGLLLYPGHPTHTFQIQKNWPANKVWNVCSQFPSKSLWHFLPSLVGDYLHSSSKYVSKCCRSTRAYLVFLAYSKGIDSSFVSLSWLCIIFLWFTWWC